MASDATTQRYFEHSSAPRLNTVDVIAASLKKQYPNLECTVVSQIGSPCDIVNFARAGHGTLEPVHESSANELPSSLHVTGYVPPARRLGKSYILRDVLFEKYLYRLHGQEYLLYVVDVREGLVGSYPQGKITFLLSATAEAALSLVEAAGSWTNELHEEVWVFENSTWQKSRELYNSIRNASWDAVILDSERKKAIIEDHLRFFKSEATYRKLGVPWKRGVIYYGPPGNGKTVSVKAMMHTLLGLEETVPSLYVRSLKTYYLPEMALNFVFSKARQMAPCYLIFEDLDTMITPELKSYFFNEVDGLKSNDGIFMLGSTNHLDRLDPGISQRPSRFDRKYFFDNPSEEERVLYCQYWQKKLKDNDEIDFPDELCTAIAGITKDFSFAYIQEAFVASLLAIAASKGGDGEGTDEDGWVSVGAALEDVDDGGDDLDKNILWMEIQKQVKILRDGMERERL